jgi:8-oxo-dGTP diphosphatase
MAADTGTRWPRVGVAVLVEREGQLLVGRRIGATHGSGTWQCPGGHLEPFEAVADCAVREVAEETGLAVRVIGPGPYVESVFPADATGGARHYITLFVRASLVQAGAEPALREPAQCAEWRWVPWHAVPEPRFAPLATLLAMDSAGP